MTNSKDIFNILEDLKSMPIFKMSLGSKELFHSNFLEFLCDVDDKIFINIMNRLLRKSNKKELQAGPDAPEYKLSREKENLDICIHHKEGRRIVYDLVIENKVKSMPRMEQLEKYVNKIRIEKKHSNCRFMLLSLATGIPDEDEIKNSWAIANYLDLKEVIEDKDNNWPQGKTYEYIKDYCEFIGKMHELQEATLNDFPDSPLFQDVELCREKRLHDLYIKLRCDKFLVVLKTLLEKKLKDELKVTLPIKFISKYNEIQEKGIYLNTSINQGVGQAAAFIHLHDNKPVNNYEIVIQGNQYRHGINSRINSNNGVDQDKVVAQEQIWEAIGEEGQRFLNFEIYPYNDQVVLPDPNKKLKKVDGCKDRDVPLNGYDTTCIYKHIDIIKKIPVKDLLPHMADDIIETIKTFKQ